MLAEHATKRKRSFLDRLVDRKQFGVKLLTIGKVVWVPHDGVYVRWRHMS